MHFARPLRPTFNHVSRGFGSSFGSGGGRSSEGGEVMMSMNEVNVLLVATLPRELMDEAQSQKSHFISNKFVLASPLTRTDPHSLFHSRQRGRGSQVVQVF